MERNKFIIIGYDKNSKFVDIKSDDFGLIYGNGYGGHGLQCNFVGGTERHKQIEKLLDEMSDKIRELHELATESVE